MKHPFLTFILMMVVFLVAPQHLWPETFFNDHASGWHWYQENVSEENEAKDKNTEDTKTSPSQHSTPPKPKNPEEIIKDYKAELARRFAKAWLHPTPPNLMAYQDMQKNMMDRSKTFSNVWMNNVYSTPHLDHTLISPVNQKARHIHLDSEKNRTKEMITHLSKSYGLFFFFSSGCAYCHDFAPIVAQFSKMYEWEVLVISTDGGTLDSFAKVVPDNGLVEQWKVQVLPSLYAVNPSSGHVIPIAHGMISMDQMEARIMALEGRKE